MIHVFSHIKKTYRVQWVVLEGGGRDPPSLTSRLADIGGAASHKEGAARASGSSKNSARTARKSKITAPGAGESDASSVPPAGGRARARWLLLQDVPEAKYVALLLLSVNSSAFFSTLVRLTRAAASGQVF